MSIALPQSQPECAVQSTPKSLSGPTTAIQSIWKALSLLRSRRALAALSVEQLEDVGISASQARAEAARPIWDAPASWKS